MKARIKGTNIIVKCIRIDGDGFFGGKDKGIYCQYINGEHPGAYETIPGDCLIEIEEAFDWQSFRAEAAKDILSNSLIPFALREFDEGTINVDYWAEQAVLWADNLITKLKEKEE